MEVSGGKLYKMRDDAQEELKKLVRSAAAQVTAPAAATRKEIADLYTSRDSDARSIFFRDIPDGGISIDQIPEATRVSAFVPAQTMANLFLSRLRVILSALVPGTPTIEVKARTPGAVYAAEYQNELTEWVADHGKLKEAMRKAAFYGMVSPYFALKFVPKPDEKREYDRVDFEALDPSSCGFEPYAKRFSWHTYESDYGSLPKSWRKFGKKKGWERIQVTEVYHPGFRYGGAKGKAPMSIWISEISGKTPSTSDSILALASPNKSEKAGAPRLDKYVGTEDLPAVPLVMKSFLEPAPGEALPPAEVLPWIPLMRMIVRTLAQLDKEVQTLNNIHLYDKEAVRTEVIQQIIDSKPGDRIFVGVDVDDSARGVNFTLRPVEMSSMIQHYLAALNTYIGLFDDITGAGPIERGISSQPEKSATEAAAITQNSSRRNKDRLEVMASAWGDIARVHHAWQRKLYGKSVTVPLPNGVERKIPVPDAELAYFSFRVDPVDLEHISRRGEIESTLTFLGQATQTISNFRGSVPRVIREALRIAGKAMGITDVDLFLEQPTLERGPVDRYIKYLQKGTPLIVLPQDDHELYIQYYTATLQQLSGDPNTPVDRLRAMARVIQEHQMHVARKDQQQMAQMAAGTQGAAPGQGPQADNRVAAPAVAAGGVPLIQPRGQA